MSALPRKKSFLERLWRRLFGRRRRPISIDPPVTWRAADRQSVAAGVSGPLSQMSQLPALVKGLPCQVPGCPNLAGVLLTWEDPQRFPRDIRCRKYVCRTHGRAVHEFTQRDFREAELRLAALVGGTPSGVQAEKEKLGGHS